MATKTLASMYQLLLYIYTLAAAHHQRYSDADAGSAISVASERNAYLPPPRRRIVSVPTAVATGIEYADTMPRGFVRRAGWRQSTTFPGKTEKSFN
ncbi:hypothetical protein FB451DRAFT_1263380 [Mycena latifolia]|nr:hypothetical protein FB451DRAFT_1263380 [Mycena latifolia]